MRAEDYAKWHYCAAECTGKVSALSDHDIIDCRVRAFVDGVCWARQEAARIRRKKKRS